MATHPSKRKGQAWTSYFVVVLMTALLWYTYWNFESLWQSTRSSFPMLQMTPIGATLFASFAGFGAAIVVVSQAKDRTQRMVAAAALALYSSSALIVFLYSLAFMTTAFILPRDPTDYIFTFSACGAWIVCITGLILGFRGRRS